MFHWSDTEHQSVSTIVRRCLPAVPPNVPLVSPGPRVSYGLLRVDSFIA